MRAVYAIAALLSLLTLTACVLFTLTYVMGRFLHVCGWCQRVLYPRPWARGRHMHRFAWQVLIMADEDEHGNQRQGVAMVHGRCERKARGL